MFASFTVMRQLHELLWYLADALDRDEARPVHADLRRAQDRTQQLTRGDHTTPLPRTVERPPHWPRS